MKPESEVVEEFNEIVNMTADELETWLKSSDSQGAGWSKDDGSGESVGHDSGRHIIEILKANPDKNPDEYTEEQIQHMRKVVSYCKRHLAQEEKSNNEKSDAEVKKTKSYMSLKNWGHDPLKKRHGGSDEAQGQDEEEEKQTGDKRKASGGQNGASKKRETRKGKADAQNGHEEDDDENDNEEEGDGDEEVGEGEGEESHKNGNGKQNGQKRNGQSKQQQTKDDNEEEAGDDDDEHEDEEEVDDANDDDEVANKNQNGNGNGKTPKKGPNKGDTVSWNWGNGQPEGKVLDVKAEKTTIKTKRGNEVTRDGDEEDPAVVLDTGKSKAIKSAHELNE
ncbi:hypothetical protein B0I35DRAFT_476630 [Stachybotrys elegans]|uniref:Hypervirulence associated protein TUDOR domain-containing protein n=1 Tax=Stachybotrys elegans TaxID=80388 RepID=A0A8K0SZV1_9HYPO|nr:hypothetical protein B0I35DRAFT_476630 [Stachybotrys elegans]